MKPIVIYPKNDSEKVILTKKEFEDYLKQAYDAGHADGYAEGKKYYPWWQYNGNTITTTNFPQPKEVYYGTGKEYNPNYTEITCNNNSTSSKVANTNLFYPGDNAVERVVPCDAHNDI